MHSLLALDPEDLGSRVPYFSLGSASHPHHLNHPSPLQPFAHLPLILMIHPQPSRSLSLAECSLFFHCLILTTSLIHESICASTLHPPTHLSIPLSPHPPLHPPTSASIHSPTGPFILTCLHPSTYQPIYFCLQQVMFWVSPCTRSWAGYCCCGDELTLIWSHRNRYLNRHLNYKINNRGLDIVFWAHHGDGRERGDGSLLSLTQQAHHRPLD